MINTTSLIASVFLAGGLSVPVWATEMGPLDVPLDVSRYAGGLYFQQVCFLLKRPCSVERPRGYRGVEPDVPQEGLRNLTARKAIKLILARHPEYQFSIADGVMILEPRRRSGEDSLSRVVPHLSVLGKSSRFAELVALDQVGLRPGEVYFGPPETYGRVTIALNNIQLRDALNAIARADGQVVWEFTPDERNSSLSWRTWRRQGGIDRIQEIIDSCPSITKRWIRIRLFLTHAGILHEDTLNSLVRNCSDKFL